MARNGGLSATEPRLQEDGTIISASAGGQSADAGGRGGRRALPIPTIPLWLTGDGLRDAADPYKSRAQLTGWPRVYSVAVTVTGEERFLFDLQGFLIVKGVLSAAELRVLNARRG